MTQTHEMDCSDAAKMLIERMQTHPEEFAYGGKLYRVTEQAQMSARDMKAYIDAHDLYIKEPALMATVLQALLAQPEEEDIGLVKFKTQGRYAFGATDPKLLYGYPVKNEDPVNDSYVLANQQRIIREMYENHIQAHRDILSRQTKAPSKVTKQSILSDIYNKAVGRERIERDN
jgi:hypothetical protein